MISQRDLFHIGIIVDDFDGTVERMTRKMQLEWSPVLRADITVWTRDFGLQDISPRAIYSRQEPCFEIVEAMPRTPLQPVAGRPMHHLGYWTDDLRSESDRLAAMGCPKILCAEEDGVMYGMAYHEMANDLIL